MPILDFKEIPRANVTNGEQDTFELFARDFLEMLGFEVETGPDRGQDGGRDLIVIEKRTGILATTQVRWLVSCKHKAHSGQSVNDADEADISDRVRAHNANGFLGFYSTIISSPLGRKISALKSNFEIMIFDQERIEAQLLVNNEAADSIARRYFPLSYNSWKLEQNEPSNLFDQYEPLRCERCGKDLLTKEAMQLSLICFVEDVDFAEKHDYEICKYENIYFACKGSCDEILETYYIQKGFITKWEDISDIMIPNHYLYWIMAVMNRIRDGEDIYSDIPYEKLKQFILLVSQFVVKNRTSEQTERLRQLAEIPEYL
ncbi:restriction endonuclease [Neobacillus sp. BF23-41]|uniref:restriction endonuclease n=1 Tax=Neobacillus sp. BF23-41 TaxID=3240280 RepID=UPI0034E3DC56